MKQTAMKFFAGIATALGWVSMALIAASFVLVIWALIKSGLWVWFLVIWVDTIALCLIAMVLLFVNTVLEKMPDK